MKEKIKQTIAATVLEAFLVVLGVVLAFAANEMRQGKLKREHARSALESVVEELKTNRAAVQESLQYHLDSLKIIARLQRQSLAPQRSDFTKGFIFPARVFRTAWESASQTGALDTINYSRVLRLNKVYAQQDWYEEQVRIGGQILLTELFHGGARAVLENYVNLASLIRSFTIREEKLLQLYEETLSGMHPKT
jgi:hypothetical protein